VTVLDVVHVDVTHSIGAVEELGLTGQVSLERGQAVERGALEVVASAAVRTTGASTAIRGLATVALAPLLGERSGQRRVQPLALTTQPVGAVAPRVHTQGHHKPLSRVLATRNTVAIYNRSDDQAKYYYNIDAVNSQRS
jgi:hypothetical protein